MKKGIENKSQSTDEQTRRAFLQSNLGRIVAGAVVVSCVEKAFGTSCHADRPHSDWPAHANWGHTDGLMSDGRHIDDWSHGNHAHSDEPHGDNPTAHSDATGRHNDSTTTSTTGHVDYTDHCVHNDTPSHSNQVHTDQQLHVDNCN